VGIRCLGMAVPLDGVPGGGLSISRSLHTQAAADRLSAGAGRNRRSGQRAAHDRGGAYNASVAARRLGTARQPGSSTPPAQPKPTHLTGGSCPVISSASLVAGAPGRPRQHRRADQIPQPAPGARAPIHAGGHHARAALPAGWICSLWVRLGSSCYPYVTEISPSRATASQS